MATFGTAPPTHLLMDGDVLAFIAAAAAQTVYLDWDTKWARHQAHGPTGEAIVDNMVATLKADLSAQSAEVYLSDPKDNWRYSVDPTYKGHRTGERPLLLDYLKDYIRERHGAVHWDGLEADDVLGIRGTQGHTLRTVIVGRDKDFKTIPGHHHGIKQDQPGSVRDISPWEAQRFHLIQTLAGDPVDGYSGCPGLGMTRAERVIDTPMVLVPKPGVKTRGVNKGEGVTRWMSEPTQDLWACIVSHYRKAGLGEQDALKTARLANILHADQYEDGKITLWTPDRIKKYG